MSGNCATGSAVMASRPAMVMTAETTKASRGRRMNSDEMVMALLLGLGRRRARRHGHAVADALLALDDDLLAFLEPFRHDQLAAAHDAGLDAAQRVPCAVAYAAVDLVEGDRLLGYDLTAVCGWISSRTTRTVWPSVRRLSLLSKVARTIWPSVLESTVMSMKSILPFSL